MLDSKSGTIDAPGVAARVIQFRNDGNLSPIVIVENLDGSSSADIKYQEFDGSAWSDLVGTNVTVNPGTSNAQILSGATERTCALFAGGNVKLMFHLIRQADGELDDYGDIL